MRTDTKFFKYLRSSFLTVSISSIFAVVVILTFLIFYSVFSQIQSDKDANIGEFRDAFSSELIESIESSQKSSLDDKLDNKILSLDYEDKQEEDSLHYGNSDYQIYISYDENNNISTLNFYDSYYGGEIIENLDIAPYSLMANQSLKLSYYKNLLIFSIDSQASYCDYDCTEIETPIIQAGNKYGGIWSYNIETEELKHLYKYKEDEVINYNRYYENIPKSPLIIIRNTASINGDEVSYKIQTLNSITGELNIIHEDTTL